MSCLAMEWSPSQAGMKTQKGNYYDIRVVLGLNRETGQ